MSESAGYLDTGRKINMNSSVQSAGKDEFALEKKKRGVGLEGFITAACR